MILEFGVKTGGTIRKLSERFPHHQIYGFDWFRGLREDWAKVKKGGLDMGGKPPENLPSNVELVVGIIEETLIPFLDDNPLAVDFVHLDVDVYGTTKFILDCLGPRMFPGTILHFDEYWGYADFENYEFRAFAEFREQNPHIRFGDYELDFQLGPNPAEQKSFQVKGFKVQP